MTDEREEERSAAIYEFYRIYRRLQKRYSLRMHSRFSIYDDGLIEVYEYSGDKRGKCVLKVKEAEETACYKRAIEELKNYEKDRS